MIDDYESEFQLFADSFDLDFGVKTEGLDHNNYGPVRAAVFNDIMRFTQAKHQNQWFIDIGSGKGRALILAAQYSFKKIFGIEKCEDFCEIAKENLERAKKK